MKPNFSFFAEKYDFNDSISPNGTVLKIAFLLSTKFPYLTFFIGSLQSLIIIESLSIIHIIGTWQLL